MALTLLFSSYRNSNGDSQAMTFVVVMPLCDNIPKGQDKTIKFVVV